MCFDLNENHQICKKIVRFVQIPFEMYLGTVELPALISLSVNVSDVSAYGYRISFRSPFCRCPCAFTPSGPQYKTFL